MWDAAAPSWTGHLDDLPPNGEILVGWPADLGKSPVGPSRSVECPIFDLRVLRVGSDGTSFVPVRWGGIPWDEGGVAGPRAPLGAGGFGSVGVLPRQAGSGLKLCEGDGRPLGPPP
jgi:hypothetical protein